MLKSKYDFQGKKPLLNYHIENNELMGSLQILNT